MTVGAVVAVVVRVALIAVLRGVCLPGKKEKTFPLREVSLLTQQARGKRGKRAKRARDVVRRQGRGAGSTCRAGRPCQSCQQCAEKDDVITTIF